MSGVKTTKDWLDFFKSNEKKQLKVPFDNYQLTLKEKEMITKSIQSFQLGESSTGENLKRYARQYSEKYSCPYYPELMNLFIKEENRHSSYLWQFMRQHNIPRAEQTTNDSIFRYLRSLLGIELSLRVLVTAETIALSYYKVLGEVTNSSILPKICDHMLEEERVHLRFQMQHIQMVNLKKNNLWAFLSDFIHVMFIFVTCFAVWFEHKRVLSFHYSFKGFLIEVLNNFVPGLLKGREDAIQLSEVEYGVTKEVSWA